MGGDRVLVVSKRGDAADFIIKLLSQIVNIIKAALGQGLSDLIDLKIDFIISNRKE